MYVTTVILTSIYTPKEGEKLIRNLILLIPFLILVKMQWKRQFKERFVCTNIRRGFYIRFFKRILGW